MKIETKKEFTEKKVEPVSALVLPKNRMKLRL